MAKTIVELTMEQRDMLKERKRSGETYGELLERLVQENGRNYSG